MISSLSLIQFAYAVYFSNVLSPLFPIQYQFRIYLDFGFQLQLHRQFLRRPIFRRLSTLLVMTVQGVQRMLRRPNQWLEVGNALFSRGYNRQNGSRGIHYSIS